MFTEVLVMHLCYPKKTSRKHYIEHANNPTMYIPKTQYPIEFILQNWREVVFFWLCFDPIGSLCGSVSGRFFGGDRLAPLFVWVVGSLLPFSVVSSPSRGYANEDGI